MHYDPENLARTIALFNPTPLPPGSIPWGCLQVDNPNRIGLLVEFPSHVFVLFNAGSYRCLDQAAVLAAIRSSII